MKKEQKQPIVKLGRLVPVGGSLYIAIPKAFVDEHSLKPGERVPIIAGRKMTILPMREV